MSTRRTGDIPDENILDLRAQPQEDPHGLKPKRGKKQHVDFLSLVEEGEERVTEKVHSFFRRREKPQSTVAPVEVPTIVETAAPPPSPRSASLPNRKVPFGAAIRFAVLLLLLTAGVVGARTLGNVQRAKADVLGTSAEALQRVLAAGTAAQDLQFNTSADELQAAQQAFATAEQQLLDVAGSLSSLPGAGKVRRAQALLEAGQVVTQAAAKLAHGAQALADEGDGLPLLRIVEQFRTSLAPAAVDLARAAELLQEVQPADIPETYRDAFTAMQAQLPSLEQQFRRLERVGSFLEQFLAVDGTPKRYLFLFQNSNELRPTGGFLGSMAVVDVSGGAIAKVEIPSGGIYDIAGQTGLRYVAPEPMQLVQANWNLQDANWFPDFPTSAQKVLAFYESAGEPSVDGVVAFTPAVLESFLRLTGPVEVPEVGETFTAETFTTKLQILIKEAEKKDYTKPKLVLGYLAPKILSRALSLERAQLWEMLGKLQEHLVSRDIQLYFTDAQAQATVADLGWTGALQTSPRDFLHVNRTNLGGGKTDGAIEEVDSHEVSIAPDGTVTATLTIIRKHNGLVGDKFTGDRNVSYLRAYVPQGSELLSASGFERIDPKRFRAPSPDRVPDPDLVALDAGAIVDATSGTRVSQEGGRTVFGNWMGVGPGEVAKATITYRLPFTLKVGGLLDRSDSYSLLVQMQPGTRVNFSSKLFFPQGWVTSWTGSTAQVFTQESAGTYRMSAVLDRDAYYGMVLKK